MCKLYSIFDVRGYFEISVFELSRADHIFLVIFSMPEVNRIYDGVEAETKKSQASFQII